MHGWESPHTAVEIVIDDMPFLVDSIGIELNRRGFGVHLIIHPVIQVRRDGEGNLLEVLPHGAEAEGTLAESVIHVEVARQTDPAELEQLEGHLVRVIDEVRSAVADWREMRARALTVVAELGTDPPPLDADEIAETRAFLVWLEDHNFVFLGYREYELSGERRRAVARVGAGHRRSASCAKPAGRRARAGSRTSRPPCAPARSSRTCST